MADSIPLTQTEDVRVGCHRCGDQIPWEEAVLKTAGQRENKYLCKTCNNVGALLAKHSGPDWCQREFASMSEDKRRSFWKEAGKQKVVTTGRLCYKAVRATLLKSVANRRIESFKDSYHGEYLPLSVWASRGFDPKLVAEKGLKEEHEVFGETFAVQIHNFSKEEIHERVSQELLEHERKATANAKAKSKPKKKSQPAGTDVQDVPSSQSSVMEISEDEGKRKGQKAGKPPAKKEAEAEEKKAAKEKERVEKAAIKSNAVKGALAAKSKNQMLSLVPNLEKALANAKRKREQIPDITFESLEEIFTKSKAVQDDASRALSYIAMDGKSEVELMFQNDSELREHVKAAQECMKACRLALKPAKPDATAKPKGKKQRLA